MDVFEIQFPDQTVARYPRDRVMDLISLQKVKPHWSARLKGTNEWSTLDQVIGRATALSGAPAISVPRPPASMSGGEVDPSPTRSADAAPIQFTPEIKTRPAAQVLLENQETVIASIGQKMLVGFLKGEGLAMTNIILTDKRIYGRGRLIDRSVSVEGWMVGDVSAISAVSLVKASDWKKLAFGVLLFFVALVVLKISELVGALIFMAATVFLIVYFVTRRKVLQFNLTGLAYNFSMGGVDDETIRSFMEQTILFLANRKKL